MSCAYRHAAVRIATIAGIPPDLMLTAMDIARQRRVIPPTLPPDRLRTIAPRLGITPTCGNPQQVIARIQSALIALGTLHPSQPWVERGMAIAAALGMPDDHLPVPVHPEIMETVRAQWAAPPPDPAPNRATAGIAALWRGEPIPLDLMTEALRVNDWDAIVTWMAHGVWDDRFEDVCTGLTNAEIGTIVRAGVMPNALVAQITQRWQSNDLPWDVFPLAMWDWVTNPKVAREGRARTAAAKLIRNPALRDERLIDAAAQHPRWAAEVLGATDLCDNRLIDAAAQHPHHAVAVLGTRRDLRDDCLIQAAAKESLCARNVLIARPDLSDDRLIAAAAEIPWYARDVLVARHDLSDPQLIAAVAENAAGARDVLIERIDLCDECLIKAVADHTIEPWHARDVVIARPDLRADKRLIETAARSAWTAADVLKFTDLCDDCLIAAVAQDTKHARDVLIARHDLRAPRLIAAVASDPEIAAETLINRPDLSDEPLIIEAIATVPRFARDIMYRRPDLRTDARLIDALAKEPWLVITTMHRWPDFWADKNLIAAIARNRELFQYVAGVYPEIRYHPGVGAVLDDDGTSP